MGSRSKISIEGETTPETVEITVTTNDMINHLKKFVFKNMDIPEGVYISDGKAKWDEDTSGSHYSYKTHDFKGSNEQLELIRAFNKIAVVLENIRNGNV